MPKARIRDPGPLASIDHSVPQPLRYGLRGWPTCPCRAHPVVRYSILYGLVRSLLPTRTYPMTRLLGHSFALALLALAAGCEDEPSTKPKLKTRETLNKTTQDVYELKPELAKGASARRHRDPGRRPPHSVRRCLSHQRGQDRQDEGQDGHGHVRGRSTARSPRPTKSSWRRSSRRARPTASSSRCCPITRNTATTPIRRSSSSSSTPRKRRRWRTRRDRELGRK